MGVCSFSPSLWSLVMTAPGNKHTAWSCSHWTCSRGKSWTFQKPFSGFWGWGGARMPSSISLSVLSLGGHRHCSPIWSPAALADLLGGVQVSEHHQARGVWDGWTCGNHDELVSMGLFTYWNRHSLTFLCLNIFCWCSILVLNATHRKAKVPNAFLPDTGYTLSKLTVFLVLKSSNHVTWNSGSWAIS